MAELGQTTDPRVLIPGRPETIETGATRLRDLGGRLTTTGEDLGRVDVAGWTGKASTRFHDTFAEEPPRWVKGGDTFDKAAQTLTGHAETLRWAQGQAAEAIALWAQGEAATAAAAGATPDPGEPLRQQARGILERARTQFRGTAGTTAETLLQLAQSGPWTERLPGDYPPYGTIPSQRHLSPEQLRRKTDEYLFHIPLSTFTRLRTSPLPPHRSQLDWSANGCGTAASSPYIPDRPLGYNFEPACARHDFGYGNYSAQGRFTEENRARIDEQFRRDLNELCDTADGFRLDDPDFACSAAREVYYGAVRRFGGSE